MMRSHPLAVARQRLANNSGETLVETLVSVLIGALALLMLATAISTAVDMVKTSKGRLESFYLAENDMIQSVGSVVPDTPMTFSVPVARDSKGALVSNVNVKVYSSTKGADVSVYERSAS